ncbi:MAG: hypothetical protein R6X03_09505 [Methyloceanibacter sp.]
MTVEVNFARGGDDKDALAQLLPSFAVLIPISERLSSLKLRPNAFVDAVDNLQIQGVKHSVERAHGGLPRLAGYAQTALADSTPGFARVKMLTVQRTKGTRFGGCPFAIIGLWEGRVWEGRVWEGRVEALAWEAANAKAREVGWIK